MPHTPATSARPKRSRALIITAIAIAVAALAAAGIWWGVTAASSANTAASAQSAARALPDDTSMGAVELVTASLAPMQEYYVNAVGLDVLDASSTQVSLGRDDAELITLTLDDGRPVDTATQAGLYHSAILYPDSPSLARVLSHIATAAPESYSGSADHSVSLAFYFTDPDGNGLELYTDTPEDTWVWNDGLVTMGAAPLDPNVFIQEHLGQTPSTEDTVMGHVHLRVGNLNDARAFYADTLGFDVTAESDGALFYSAGGYHHHLATNTWMSDGAGDRPKAQGLGHFTVHLGDDAALAAVADRLEAAQVAFTNDAGQLTVDDPWGNTIRLLGTPAA
ncbi:catechol 2,3-dioxygenase [Leucobacter exalbidus]|uniref:Catechol 2,3-dioxygenase n=1 Tax=Leucobacter exalbidus TaxID=662960 RepID=A0A940PVJ6_9MICO|nr:VOC family protein [Leucobacter exalbidus]MBP1324986.1 catechol 2,3-dioxygenase [Leucobacter exalbidus]